MQSKLRQDVLLANREISKRGLARFTFGNASGVDRKLGHIVIKPSGVAYDALNAEAMVVTDLDGKVVEGALKPSSDLATHAALYRAFPNIGGVVHTHSRFATVFAQAGMEIPCLGTTHADHFHGPIPITAPMRPEAIATEYEANTGAAIIARFATLDPGTMPGVLVAAHASFCWGENVRAAVENAAILEEVARLAYYTITLNAGVMEISESLRDKHFLRKHGKERYYGQ